MAYLVYFSFLKETCKGLPLMELQLQSWKSKLQSSATIPSLFCSFENENMLSLRRQESEL